MKQTTLAKPVSMTGTSLHEGAAVTLTLKPARAGEGYTFIRTDKAGAKVAAHPDKIIDIKRRTVIKDGEAEVHTIEHVLSALTGLGVDNATIELNAPEPPAGDGSAKAFMDLIDQAGIATLEAEQEVFTPTAPLVFHEGAASISCFPDPKPQTPNPLLSVQYTLDYGVPHLALQRYTGDVTPENYRKNIGPARTFCLEEEARQLQAMGFGKGANTQNTLVWGKTGVMENKLAFPDEFARHKALDIIGDLAVVGVRLNARVVGVASGHSLNQKLAKALRAQYDEAKRKPTGKGALDIQGILRVAPHRYPFLMVDRVLEADGNHAVGVKNVSYNEPCFTGHFPGRPVFPGVLQIEALAQIGGLLVLQRPDNLGKLAFFTSVESVKFRRLVVPGDQMLLEATVLRERRGLAEVEARATVNGEMCCEGTLKFMVVDEKQQQG
ncbi:MAG: UDP-3-O-[3-hydroxymyristoyl] N-acetylglucosamine deacetylase [Planctomycetes bacterium]|jgi:UDP-3-O-[3-hydroxymyristoyl] N-acetylglucosamine deacetylase/3-hydroxyacyl-[acyl-carrier-protein] dehydratase|nr:UDP-3-O-[3-hydroxymyristoyl] N-acetylglucosamine deacetylase [Planctomycetota bacterium]